MVSFPKAGGVNGTVVLDRGDINLTFKRYLEAPVRLTLESDYVTKIEGEGADAEMFRSYLAAWGDRNAYAVSHVGFGLNPKARYEALTMYDQRDTNGTEIRAVAGNFLFSTGANEFAGRYTAGHFDLPVMRTTITVDGTVVVKRAWCSSDLILRLQLRPHPHAASCAKRGVSKDGRTLRCLPATFETAAARPRQDEALTAPAAGSARNARAARRTPSAARGDRPRHRALR